VTVTEAEVQGKERLPDVWLTPGVRGIGSASLLADLGHEVPTALLPSFLTSTLGAPAAALGVIEGVSDGLAGVARFAGGALADEPERRRATAVGGYTATAVLSAGIGVATTMWQVGVLRAGAWAARGLRVPARNALLADVVPRAGVWAAVRVRACDGQPRRGRRAAARAGARERCGCAHGDPVVGDPGAAGRGGDRLRDPPHAAPDRAGRAPARAHPGAARCCTAGLGG
jgi:hypothetical protein